jgi:hypothetical protein
MKKMLWLCCAVLLVCNLGFAAWTNGWLQPWGWQPADPREPQRLEQQLRPEAMQLLPADQRQ